MVSSDHAPTVVFVTVILRSQDFQFLLSRLVVEQHCVYGIPNWDHQRDADEVQNVDNQCVPQSH